MLALCIGTAAAIAATTGAAPASPGHEVRVAVRVRTRDGLPVEGAAVRSGVARAATDTAGVARLQLPAGHQVITIVRLGLGPDTLRVNLESVADTTLEATLQESTIGIAPVIVASTRAERRLEDEPERVEVLAGEDVSEKSLTRPGDVTTLVREIAGVRLQTSTLSTGAAGLRILGLRSQYSAVLVDGLPLQCGDRAGLGLLQIPPIDVQQAEVIKGAATALYGPSALGGVLNIISRHPADGPERTLLVNQMHPPATDVALWLSQPLHGHWGATFLGGGHWQTRTDVNHDGWADLPDYSRADVRPRLFWAGDGGRSLMVTAGAMLEDRDGGGDGDDRHTIDTRQGDAGFTMKLPAGSHGRVSLRGAWSGGWQSETVFDPVFGPTRLHDDHQTGFGEGTYLRGSGGVVWLVGLAGQADDYHNDSLPALGYDFTTVSGLGQVTWTAAAWLSATAVARADVHNRYGTRLSPRVSVLAHATHAFEARLSAGAGFRAPTPFTEETTALPLTRLSAPVGLDAERARSLSLDLTAHRGFLEVNATGFLSRIANPVLLDEPPDSTSNPAAAFARLANAPGPSPAGGIELYAFYSREPITVTANYSWLDATEIDLETGIRRDVPLTPRHSAALDVAWEEDELGTRAGVEIFYTGRQSLEHDPYRSSSAPYATIGILVSQRIGCALVYINGENLADVRQTRYEPVLLEHPTPDGRLTVDPWAPAEGRTLNAGVRIGL